MMIPKNQFFFGCKDQQDLNVYAEDIDKCSYNVEGEMFSFFGDTGHRYKLEQVSQLDVQPEGPKEQGEALHSSIFCFC